MVEVTHVDATVSPDVIAKALAEEGALIIDGLMAGDQLKRLTDETVSYTHLTLPTILLV